MIVSKKNLAILAGVAKDQMNIYSLTHVLIDAEKGRMYASDGHCLYRSKLDSQFSDDDFPKTDVEIGESEKMFLIPGNVLQEVEKTIPKKQTFSIMENVQVLSDGVHNYIVTASTDCTSVTKVKNTKGKYPEVEKIEQATKGLPVKQAVVSLKQLEKLVKALKKNKEDYIRFKIFGESHPLVVEATDDSFQAHIMPIVLDD